MNIQYPVSEILRCVDSINDPEKEIYESNDEIFVLRDPLEMKEKTKDYINFTFDLIISDLKNFTNFISELKQKELKFKIIRHEDKKIKKYAFTKKIFKYFKKN